MHWCHEEMLALLALLPGAGFFVMKVKTWWHNRFGCKHKPELGPQEFLKVIGSEKSARIEIGDK